MSSLHLTWLSLLLFISVTFLHQRSYGFALKMVPDMKRAESNYKWFNVDKEPVEFTPNFQTQLHDVASSADTGNENIPLPLALSLIHAKRGMFDLGTGRGYSGFQAMRGNLGLAFASPGSHGKK